METKLISKGEMFGTNWIALRFFAKVVIAVVLTFLGIILIASVYQILFKLVSPSFLVDQIKSVYSNSSKESLIKLKLTGDRNDVPQMGDLNNKTHGNAESYLPGQQIQGDTARISIKVDHYPFFADEFDHNSYD